MECELNLWRHAMRHSLLAVSAAVAIGLNGICSAGEDVVIPPLDKPRGTIAFASQTPRGFDIYVSDVGTRKTKKLTDHPSLDFNASISPDGKRIAFVSERDGNMEIYSMNA